MSISEGFISFMKQISNLKTKVQATVRMVHNNAGCSFPINNQAKVGLAGVSLDINNVTRKDILKAIGSFAVIFSSCHTKSTTLVLTEKTIRQNLSLSIHCHHDHLISFMDH